VAGSRRSFRGWARALDGWTADTPGADDLLKVEEFRAATVDDRLRDIPGDENEVLLEVALHSGLDGARVSARAF